MKDTHHALYMEVLAWLLNAMQDTNRQRRKEGKFLATPNYWALREMLHDGVVVEHSESGQTVKFTITFKKE